MGTAPSASRWIRIAIVAVAIALAAAAAVAAEEPLVPASPDAIDEYLAAELERVGAPGLAFVLVRPGGPDHLLALGHADGSGRPVTPQTPFMLASVSKAFTAAAVMQLVEAGRVELDAPVVTYLPSFTLADADAARRVTVRHLLNQSSGLSVRSGVAYHTTDDQDEGALERQVGALATAELSAEPGDAHYYSNSNYDLLGMIVQEVSGEPFDAYLQRHIYEPLGMVHSHATRDAARADGLAEGHYPWFGLAYRPTYFELPRAGAPSATTFSSAEDLGHWLHAHLDGSTVGGPTILSPDGIEDLHTSAVDAGESFAYAMGWFVRPYWESLDPATPSPGGGAIAPVTGYALPTLIEHNGSWPNAHTYVGMVPSAGWGFALLVNAGNVEESRLALLEQNVLRLMAGREPSEWTSYEDAVVQNRVSLIFGLLAAQVLGLVWAVRTLRRMRSSADAAGSVPGRRRILLGALVTLALDLFVLWFYLINLPSQYEADFAVIIRSQPDLALAIIPSIILAAIWGPVRTILLIWGALRSRPGRVSNVAQAPETAPVSA